MLIIFNSATYHDIISKAADKVIIVRYLTSYRIMVLIVNLYIHWCSGIVINICAFYAQYSFKLFELNKGTRQGNVLSHYPFFFSLPFCLLYNLQFWQESLIILVDVW